MKTILKIMIPCLLFFAGVLSSCKKDEGIGTVGIAKINVINAIVNGGKMKVQVGAHAVTWSNIPNANSLGEDNGMGRLFVVPTNRSTLLKAVSLSDTTKVWYNQVAQLGAGKMYTLYLSGTPGNIKTSLKEESNFPEYIIRDAGRPTPTADSVVNIRFVNLSPSGPTVDVDIQEQSSSIVSGLKYEEFTDFNVYPAKTGIYTIIFQIKKSSDKTLLSTYYFDVNSFRFKSAAVVIMGIYDPDFQLPLSWTDRYQIVAVPYQ